MIVLKFISVGEDSGVVLKLFVTGNDGKSSHETKSWNCPKTGRCWKRI